MMMPILLHSVAMVTGRPNPMPLLMQGDMLLNGYYLEECRILISVTL